MNSHPPKLKIRLLSLLVVALTLVPGISCSTSLEPEIPQQETMDQRDINDVLRDHDDELMAIPGVVGVYVGLLDDDETTCLKVMAAEKTPELERKVPKSLEGYPVVLVESGVIRPLQDK